MTVLVSLLVALTEEMNLRHSFVKIASTLKVLEDGELLTGLYGVIRSAQGSFTKGNIALFVVSVLAMHYTHFPGRWFVIYTI